MLFDFRYIGTELLLDDLCVIEVTGEDRERFFQGQFTNDVKSLNKKDSMLNVRLNRQGRIQSFFQLAKLEDKFIILIDKSLKDPFLTEIDMFIIMDDVVLTPVESKVKVNLLKANNFTFKGNYFGELAYFTLTDSAKEIKSESLNDLAILSGWPLWNVNVFKDQLLNETILNDLAISYQKGCFLGQETVAKIENNRGSAFYPVLLKGKEELSEDLEIEGLKVGKVLSKTKYEGCYFHQASLKREYRVENKNIIIDDNEFEVLYLPLFKDFTLEEKSLEIYHQATQEFNHDNEEIAEKLFRLAIDLDPKNADAYESLGVLLGRHEKFDEAISLMDQLLKVDEKSVLAHTNKSLFLMKQGKIEAAEAEKDQATMKSFAMYGEQANMKKIAEEQKQKEAAELARREEMFKQVLEMDSEDTIANNGMGEILFKRGDFSNSINHLEKVITIDESYSVAYLTLGKSLEALGENAKAKNIYEKGIAVASKRGDLMPANEMQSRLSKL